MPSRIEAVLWDTCVVIDAIQKTPGRYEYIAPFITSAEEGKLKIVISMMTVSALVYLKEHDKDGMARQSGEALGKMQ